MPCLFAHTDNGVEFTLVVDDFGVSYSSREGAEHLRATIAEHYPLTVD